jgi:hypothetical protein
MNKKGQALSIVFFFIIILSVFILGVLLMSMVNTILDPFREQISLVSNESATTVGVIQNKFNSVWDWTIVILFLFNVVILMFSSFMVDIHPAFLVIYIIALMFLFMFGSTILGSLNALYNPTGVFGSGNVTAGGNAYANMPLTFWMLNNFTMVILGIAILSGIIMYAKFKFGNSTGGNY